MIVVDASAVADFLLGRPAALDAFDRELEGREHDRLHAPELIEPATLNALRRLAAKGAISDERAGEAVRDLGELRFALYPHMPLRERVWALRAELSAYDATYLALAEALDATVLLTADRGLAARARASVGAERVRELA